MHCPTSVQYYPFKEKAPFYWRKFSVNGQKRSIMYAENMVEFVHLSQCNLLISCSINKPSFVAHIIFECSNDVN